MLEVGETKAEVPYWAANGIVLLIVLGALTVSENEPTVVPAVIPVVAGTVAFPSAPVAIVRVRVAGPPCGVNVALAPARREG